MKILVSRCLLGEPCRYDGKSKPVEALLTLERQGHILVPVCPEEDGGLPTPRPPAEIQEDGRVVNRLGIDMTAEYTAGAYHALRLAREHGCTVAVLKEKSPSCGSGRIYDGSFSGTLTDGFGVTAQLLRREGIRVLGESELEKLLREE